VFKSSARWLPFVILLCWFAAVFWFFKSIGGVRSLSDFFDATTKLDVVWYKKIAERGYFLDPTITDGQSTAFFPLLPLLAALFIHVFSMDSLVALQIVQKTSLVALVYCVFRWAKDTGFSPKESLLNLLLHPAFVFLMVPYTESLYLLCLFSLLIAWNKKSTLGFAASAYLLGLCRPTGLFVIPAGGITIAVFALQAMRQKDRRSSDSLNVIRMVFEDAQFKSSFKMLVFGILASAAALASIALVMEQSVGDWYAFYRYRGLWKEEPSLGNLFKFLNFDFGMNTARILVSWAAIWGCVLLLKSKRTFEGVLCLVSILLPAYQGKMGDIIRYTMGAAPAWIILSERYKESRVWTMTFMAFSSSVGIYMLSKWLNNLWAG
jgi:hypothetical protein